MTDKAIEARREYRRNWAKANPDKIRLYQQKYWEKKAGSGSVCEDAQEPKEKSNLS